MASPVNASLVAPLQTLAAPRMARPPTHRVRDILVITVCTLLRGGEGGQARERCGKSQRAWRPTCLAVPNGMASHDTLGRLFARLNPQRLHKCFVSWPRAVSPLTHKPGHDILSASAEIPDCIPHQSCLATSAQKRCRTASHGCGGALASRPALRYTRRSPVPHTLRTPSPLKALRV